MMLKRLKVKINGIWLHVAMIDYEDETVGIAPLLWSSPDQPERRDYAWYDFSLIEEIKDEYSEKNSG